MAGRVQSKEEARTDGHQTKSCQKVGKLPHTVVYTCGKWMCSACGVSFKTAGRHGVAIVGGRTSCMGKNSIKEATQNSHCIHTVEGGRRNVYSVLLFTWYIRSTQGGEAQGKLPSTEQSKKVGAMERLW